MRVTLYEMEANDEGSSRPVRSIEVETDADTSVAGLLEQGSFVEHEFFSLATETSHPDRQRLATAVRSLSSSGSTTLIGFNFISMISRCPGTTLCER